MTTNKQTGLTYYLGIAGFVAAGVSAALSTAAILAWRYNADRMNADMSGGVAFAMNIGPLVWTLAGISIAFLALLIMGISVGSRREGRSAKLTLFQVASLGLLLPSAFLLFRMLVRYFRP